MMKKTYLMMLLAFCLGVITSIGWVAGASVPSDRIEIKTDRMVEYIIGGKPVMTVDARGLHVYGDIDYSGTIADTGAGSAGQ